MTRHQITIEREPGRTTTIPKESLINCDGSDVEQDDTFPTEWRWACACAKRGTWTATKRSALAQSFEAECGWNRTSRAARGIR